MTISEVHGVTVLSYPVDGPLLAAGQDVLDLIGDAFGSNAEIVAIPADRLGEDFFTLRTRMAGEIVQKFVNYRLRLVVVGDISDYVARSDALRDFVFEANRGRQLWFVADAGELDRRLAA
ncbi:DUF4180 domain-containing protein [Luedemannella flava]|uniref:DUF4180 domain-containing protein n=1 Tax=Luedemannella flava TaxID=349316 RepID=UPI0031E2AA32